MAVVAGTAETENTSCLQAAWIRLRFPGRASIRYVVLCWSALAKVSDWNSLQSNLNHSGICNRTKQFHSDLIRRNFSIRMNPKQKSIRASYPHEFKRTFQSVCLIRINTQEQVLMKLKQTFFWLDFFFIQHTNIFIFKDDLFDLNK